MLLPQFPALLCQSIPQCSSYIGYPEINLYQIVSEHQNYSDSLRTIYFIPSLLSEYLKYWSCMSSPMQDCFGTTLIPSTPVSQVQNTGIKYSWNNFVYSLTKRYFGISNYDRTAALCYSDILGYSDRRGL